MAAESGLSEYERNLSGAARCPYARPDRPASPPPGRCPTLSDRLNGIAFTLLDITVVVLPVSLFVILAWRALGGAYSLGQIGLFAVTAVPVFVFGFSVLWSELAEKIENGDFSRQLRGVPPRRPW